MEASKDLADWTGFPWSDVEQKLKKLGNTYRMIRTYPISRSIRLNPDSLYVLRQTQDENGFFEFIVSAKQDETASQQEAF